MSTIFGTNLLNYAKGNKFSEVARKFTTTNLFTSDRYRTPMRMLTAPHVSKKPFVKEVKPNDDSMILRRRISVNFSQGAAQFPGRRGTYKNDNVVLRRRVKTDSMETFSIPSSSVPIKSKFNEETSEVIRRRITPVSYSSVRVMPMPKFIRNLQASSATEMFVEV